MGGDVDDVVASAHDVHVAVVVDHACVACVDPFALETDHVAFVEPLLVFPKCGQTRRCERDTKDDVAHGALLDLIAIIIDNSHIKARHRLSCTSWTDGKCSMFALIAKVQTDGW